MAEESNKKRKDRKFLTLFIMIMPSLLIAMTGAVNQLTVRIGLQVVLLLFHLVIFKNILDDFYGE